MQPGGIPVVTVKKISSATLSELCRDLGKESDVQVAHVRDLPAKLLRCLPTLKSIVESLQYVRLPATGLELFDVSTARWVTSTTYSSPGAYRTAWHGTTYFYVSEESAAQRQGRVADVRTVKYLAAADAGQPLLTYIPEDRALFVPMGCELPGLLARAAVMCSAIPPRKENGQVRYGQVPEEIAEAIWCRIS